MSSDDKARRGDAFDDAFEMYRDGGDGNAGRDPWDPDAPPESGPWARSPRPFEQSAQMNTAVLAYGIISIITSIFPDALSWIAGIVTAAACTTKAKRLYRSGILDTKGRAGRILGRISWFLFFAKILIAIAIIAYAAWALDKAMAIGA